jgi:gluconolactonase
MSTTRDLRVLAHGLDHPEGVAEGPDGMLYAGGEAGQVYRVDPSSGDVEQIADTEGFVLGVALDAAGAIYLCDAGRAAILRVGTDGAVDVYCDRSSGSALAVPNWLAFEADGSLLFTDSGTEDFDTYDGRIVRVPAGGGEGETLAPDTPINFPNGLAVDLDGSAYFLETFTPRLSRLRDGQVEKILDMPGTAPDGLALTSDGGLVISCYYPYRLYYLPPGSTEPQVLLDDEVGLSMPNPTNTAFFGPDRSTLAITGHGGHFLTSLETSFTGAPLHRP